MVVNPRRVIVVAGTVAILALTGCGSDEPGKTGSSSTASSTAGNGGSGGATTSGAGSSGVGGATVMVNHSPIITSPGDLLVDEEKPLAVAIKASDPDGDPLRLFLTDLPPGALWDEAAGQLTRRRRGAGLCRRRVHGRSRSCHVRAHARSPRGLDQRHPPARAERPPRPAIRRQETSSTGRRRRPWT